MAEDGTPGYGERPSVGAYLVRERRADYKSDYVYGVVKAMTGGSYRHGAIALNVGISIGSQLKGKRCQAVSSDVKVEADPDGLYVYPDLTVVCDEPRFLDTEKDVLTNPTVVVEVISPSTEAYDRGLKSVRYRGMPTLREYLLIAQDRPLVERYVRQADGLWYVETFEGMQGVVTLSSIECTVPLADIYDRVTFGEE